MQILKENKIFSNYILPIISIPFVCMILNEVIKFLFQFGKYYGTFIRGLFEIVIKYFLETNSAIFSAKNKYARFGEHI